MTKTVAATHCCATPGVKLTDQTDTACCSAEALFIRNRCEKYADVRECTVRLDPGHWNKPCDLPAHGRLAQRRLCLRT
jgi:hypothetical protein